MKLTWNGMDLASLGTLRVLSHTTAREPVEAPQRERVMYRMRLDFFEQTYLENHQLVEELRGALRASTAQLVWEDDSGATLLNRTVTASEDQMPEEAGARGGTYWQGVIFTFWYYNHDLTTACLQATYQSGAAGTQPVLGLGAVEKWAETVNVTRWDDLRSARKRVEGSGRASGRFQADTTQGVAACQAQLLRLKDEWKAALVEGAEGTLQFGTFNQVVRVGQFQAEVDQPNHSIGWTLTWTHTVYPNESEYALLELTITRRLNRIEGIGYLTLAGTIHAPSYPAAVNRLNLLKGALVPNGYVLLDEDAREVRAISESDGGGDGEIFREVAFTFQYRDGSGRRCTFQRLATGAPALDLGTVDKYREGYTSELFSELRPHRKRAGGQVSIHGLWFCPEGMSDADQVAALGERKRALDGELKKGASGKLKYSSVFDQTVRVLDFQCHINRVRHAVEWSLAGSYTRFPNESDYAVCEFRLGTREDRTEGVRVLALSGRIGAPTAEFARAKLARLRSQLVPAGYTLRHDHSEENRISSESDAGAEGSRTNQGDGDAFIELTINEEWQRASGGVLAARWRRVDEDDARTCGIRTTYSGTLEASGASAVAAFVTAKAKAAELGANKYPFLLRSTITEVNHLVQTSGQVIIAVEFSYEYQRKGAKLFLDCESVLSEETFGGSTEQVQGQIAAPTLAEARAFYEAEVRGASSYATALVLHERKPTRSEEVLKSGTTETRLDQRFSFHFQVFHPKAESQTAMSYTLVMEGDVQRREKTTSVEGSIQAASEAVANAFLDTFITGLLAEETPRLSGKRARYRRTPRYQTGNAANGSKVTVFAGLDFTEAYVDILSGTEGILNCEVEEVVVYSGDRLVEKPIPDGASIIQRCGTTCGQRTVRARAAGTTETACRTWVEQCHQALVPFAGEYYEVRPEVSTRFIFAPQTEGVARGEGANAQLVEVQGVFGAWIPVLVYGG